MNTTEIREQLRALLNGGNAHKPFRDTAGEFPVDRINDRVPGIPYSPWELLEHIRLAQEDILEFIQNPEYRERAWPEEYWPEKPAVADENAWNGTVERILDGLETLNGIVTDTSIDLTADLPYAPGYSYVREILIAADHMAYHTGQLLAMQRVLSAE